MTRRTKQPTTPEELLEANLGLPYHIAKRYKVPEEDYEDMIQEGMLALWRACLGYKPNDNNTFGTYAGMAISRAYDAYARKAWNNSGLSASKETITAAYYAEKNGDRMLEGYDLLNQSALSIEYTLYKDDDDAATIGDMLSTEDDYSHAEGDEISDVVTEGLAYLCGSERKLLKEFYGIGCEAMSRKQLAAKYNVTSQTICNQLRAAKRHLEEELPKHASDLLE